MSTPTPRTDAEAGTLIDADEVVPADFARELERELTALTADRDQLRARAERAEADEIVALTHWNKELERAMKAEAQLHALTLICGTNDANKFETWIDRANARAEKAEAQLADWSVLKGWGGTPEIVHKFIKGQQHRIHYCQNIEAELAIERARLDWLETPSGMDWQWEPERLTVSRASIDAAMKEDAK